MAPRAPRTLGGAISDTYTCKTQAARPLLSTRAGPGWGERGGPVSPGSRERGLLWVLVLVVISAGPQLPEW